MSLDSSIADYLNSAEKALVAGNANAPELVGTEGILEGLGSAVSSAKEAINRQNVFRAQAQQATRDLEDAMIRLREFLSRLRTAVQTFYGRRSEKNAEFGFNVFRAAQRKPNTPPPAPENKKPSEPGPNPAQTAAPETDGSTF